MNAWQIPTFAAAIRIVQIFREATLVDAEEVNKKVEYHDEGVVAFVKLFETISDFEDSQFSYASQCILEMD